MWFERIISFFFFFNKSLFSEGRYKISQAEILLLYLLAENKIEEKKITKIIWIKFQINKRNFCWKNFKKNCFKKMNIPFFKIAYIFLGHLICSFFRQSWRCLCLLFLQIKIRKFNVLWRVFWVDLFTGLG